MAALRAGTLQYVLSLVSDCFHIRFDCGYAVHMEKPREFIVAHFAM